MKMFLESTVDVLPQSFSFWLKWRNDLSSVLQLLVTYMTKACVGVRGSGEKSSLHLEQGYLNPCLLLH